jgi:diadenosine tetraphosphate (Ap4A) HIT family hydrolase
MATKKDELVGKLSYLSIKTQQETDTNNGLNSVWLIPYSFKCGYSFQCPLTFRQLVDRQLSEKYVQELLFLTEQNNNIYDFHMRLRSQGQYGLTVEFIYKNADDQLGPVKGEVCSPCDTNSQLSKLSLIKQNPTTCIWLDAQLRNKLIVTPRRHIERLSDMTKEEMVQFWYDTQAVLDEEGCDWQSMDLNHGKYRKHFHLHMKINIEQHQWNQSIKKKYEEKIQQMQHLVKRTEQRPIKTYSGERKFNQWSTIMNDKAKGNACTGAKREINHK